MDKLNNLSTLVCSELNNIGNNLNNKNEDEESNNQGNIQVNNQEMPFGQGNYGELMKKLLKEK